MQRSTIKIQYAEEYNTNTVCRGGVGETGIWHLGTPLRALPLLVTQPSTPAHRNPPKVFKIQITNTSLYTTMYKATHVTHPRFSLSPSYRMGLRYITRVILFTSVTLITLVTLVILSLFQSPNQLYRAELMTISGFLSYVFNHISSMLKGVQIPCINIWQFLNGMQMNGVLCGFVGCE